MVTISELKRKIESEKSKQKKLRIRMDALNEKKRLKSKLFNMKHERKIKVVKNIGKGFKTAGGNLAYNVKSLGSSFQEQRKKKKGIGGFLQRIANNQ